jgi:2-oxo-4-hydroxy-4-carboxy--5-ureidoimidazoline (OHCU) decarboxylase
MIAGHLRSIRQIEGNPRIPGGAAGAKVPAEETREDQMTEILSQLRDEEFCLLAELEAAAMEFSIPFPPPIPIPIY